MWSSRCYITLRKHDIRAHNAPIIPMQWFAKLAIEANMPSTVLRIPPEIQAKAKRQAKKGWEQRSWGGPSRPEPLKLEVGQAPRAAPCRWHAIRLHITDSSWQWSATNRLPAHALTLVSSSETRLSCFAFCFRKTTHHLG